MQRAGKRLPVVGGLVAVAAVAATTGLVYGLREIMPVVSTGVVFLLPVLLVSSYWGLWLGLLTSVASTLTFNFFHIPPTGRFTIDDPEHWVALGAYFVAAVVTSTLADAAQARAREAEQGRKEAALAADMARLLLGAASTRGPLAAVGQRIADAFGLAWVEIVPEWRSSDERRRAIALVVDGERAGTMLVPGDTPRETLDALGSQVVPALEALVGAARRREELESQVIETKALRRSNVVKTTLLRSVSHDLQLPVTAIKAAAEGLGGAGLSEEDRRELTSVVSVESDRLDRLVGQLLDLSRLQSGAAQPRSDWVSVEEIVRGAVASVTEPVGGFDVGIEADLPLITADAAQLERAIANVVENAVQHAGEGHVTVRVRAPGPRILVRVGDHGPGIAREELERIFEPFYHSPDEARGGSGLGLAIARGFIEANGGRVRAESLPGQGTTVIIDLPVPAESGRATAEAASESPLT